MRRLLRLAILLPWLLLARPLSAQLKIAARAADITVGGLLHTQYSISSVDGSAAATTDAIDDVFVRRARILLDLKLGVLEARVEPDFGGGGAGVGLADMYARVTLARPLRLSVGQFKRAFSIFELHSDTDLPDIERDARIEGLTSCPGVGNVCSFSRLAAQLQFDERDMGLRADGDLGAKVQYLATLTNGQGRNNADVNDAKSVSGRLTVALTPTLKLAGYAASHDYLTAAKATERAQAMGADLDFGVFRKGPHLMAGVVGGDNWLSGPDASFNAVQGIVSWYAALPEGGRLAGIEPMLRVDRSSTEDAAGLGLSALILSPGISFYVDGKNWLGLNFDHYDPSRGDSAWSLKTQFFFYY
ncbi:MAG: hypothetical protein EXR95_10125 [Gemmatimonadetes bacterium]|nr:hypothetical protein [Gemmatimonadota bacterium]